MESEARTIEPGAGPAEPLTDARDAGAQSPRGAGQPVSDWGAATFVWGTWALMLLAGLAWVARYTVSSPYGDDYALVPYLTGAEPVTAAWLWSQSSEHRNPIQRLILVGLARLSGCDFRAGVVFNVLALGGLAFAMLLAAKRLRGRAAYSDAFFPLALMHWGQGEVLTMSHTVDIVAAAIVSGILLVIIAGSRGPSNPAGALPAGACLLLLPLCGAMGLMRVPLLALWLGCWGLLRWRSPAPSGRRNGLLIFGLAAAALVLVGLYMMGYQRPSHCPPSPGPRAALVTGVQSLSMGLGPTAASFWPLSGWVVLGVLTASVGVLAVAWRNQPQDRLRLLGLCLFLAGSGLLALGIGWGRSGFGPGAGLVHRYTTTSVLALCCAYFIWGTCNSPAVRSFGQMCLFALTASTVALNTQAGREYGNMHRDSMAAFERDLEGGVPSSQLITRHMRYIYFNSQDYLPDYFRMLRQAGAGKFRHLKDDPPLEEVPLPVEPVEVEQVDWGGGTARATGNAPSLTFALSEPRLVWAVRITYTYPDGEQVARAFELLWAGDKRAGFSDQRRYANSYLGTGPGEQTATILVTDTVGRFRIRPDNKPCVFKLSKIVLLVPAGDPRRPPGP